MLTPTHSHVVFENDAGKIISFHDYVRLVWKRGDRTDEDIMEALNKTLETGKVLNICRLLVDQEFIRTCSVEVEVWFKYDWLSRARMNFDFGAAAVLSSRNLLVRIATLGMLNHLVGNRDRLRIKVFHAGQEEEAIQWLLQQHAPEK
ncbi:STAS/SEC14 domain-containing protein [Hymenobacter sp. NST-14]|uniref:STAS/SEC14 domain-containing protein n=1 Tax=Hymenobacter piscis TaxID=2839984 RepID=UPI001C01EC91|nr:STAS/SEC14 domain-containing protein [Hymenobacter piscis]MBT9394440.1 STAS/SEC14 domain-containing protein [Hymenobacter piscis]